MSNDDWVDELVSEIAKKYRIVVNGDDPVLITAILNREILSKAQLEYETLFIKNGKLLQEQLKAQQLSNEILLTKVSERLIHETNTKENSVFEVDEANILSSKSYLSKILLVILVFMTGLVSGVYLAYLV